LIKAGCFDTIENNRAKLLNNLPKIIEFIEQERANENQGSLFDIFADSQDTGTFAAEIKLDEYPVFTLKEQLMNEKLAIGYYLTASLFDEYHDIAKKIDVYPLSKFNTEDEDIQEIINSRYAKHKPKVLIGGIINYMGSRPTKKGGKIAFIRIEDASGDLEFVVFNEQFEQYKNLLKIDELVFVEGEVIFDSFRNEVKVNAEKILLLDEVLAAKVSVIELDIHSHSEWQQIRPMVLSQQETGASVIINYTNSQATCNLRLPESVRIQPEFKNFEQLTAIVGKTDWRLRLNRL
jgi:DNA polymerase-3 subunit alpha